MLFSKIKIKPLSVNKAWQGKRFKTNDYKSYEKELLLKLPNLDINPKQKLTVEIEWGFSNSGSDIDNPTKPFLDILQKKYGFNDSNIYELHLYKKKVCKEYEYISFSIKCLQNRKTNHNNETLFY